MISPTKTAPTIVTNALPGESRAFTIKATGKAFRILIDGLYSRKEAAVVREIMSNAWDSHMANGTPDAQIKVTCPTTMDPIFRVRDYGVSMTHEQIMDLYTRIFESTKEATNDQLGQFGLGSKTPFAYTDSFSVTAWLNGEKRSYVAYITDDDVPVINHVGTAPQGDEPQGVEISVPVRPADLHTFKKEIAHMVMASDVLPILDGMTMPDDLFVHEGEGYRVVRDEYSMGQFAVRQGCVVYPVTTLNSQYINYGYTLILDVPIGSVDVTANRESLSLNDTTRSTVQKRLTEVNDQIQAYVDEVNASFPNRLAAFKAYGSHADWLRTNIGTRVLSLCRDSITVQVPFTDRYGVTTVNPRQVQPKPRPGLVEQLNCYHTKTKTKPVYQFVRTDNIILLVDNGEAMIRRNIRIGDFYASNNHSQVAVVKRDELPRLVRVLGLTRKQVRTLQEIPDVAPASTKGQNAGLYSAPKTLAHDVLWMPKTGVKSVQASIGDAYIGTSDDVQTYTWSRTLNALGIDPAKIVFLTEKQAENMKAPQSQRLDKVLVAKAEAYATKNGLQAKFQAAADHALCTEMDNYWNMQTVIQNGFKCRFPDALRNVVWDQYSALVKSLRPAVKEPQFTDIDGRVREILKLTRSGTLTKAAIETKVVAEMKVYAPLFKDANVLDTLVKFYIANQ